jgi:hypothetical protein
MADVHTEPFMINTPNVIGANEIYHHRVRDGERVERPMSSSGLQYADDDDDEFATLETCSIT